MKLRTLGAKIGFGLQLMAVVSLVACSTESNINSFFVSDKQKEAMDVLIASAELAYDAGDFELAKEKAEAAYAINPNNEKVAILLGYVYLSYAGIDLIQLAKSLMKNSGTSSGSSTGSSTGTSTGTSTGSSSTNAASQLGSLSSVVNVESADLQKLGTVDTEPEAFAQYPVIHPFDASVARDKGVATLVYVNKAIKVVCPFVSDSVKVADDPRHKADACPKSDVTIQYAGKSNFLWAFSHLADALVFYNVLMYSTQGSGLPNFEARAKVVSSGASDITTYLSMISGIAEDVAAIFQTSNTDSQINAVLNGLTTAATAFGAIGGGEEFTSGITKALATVKSSASATTQAQSSTLTSQLTTGLSKSLNEKATALKTADPTKFAENKSSICAAFDTISAGQGTEKPADCSTY